MGCASAVEPLLSSGAQDSTLTLRKQKQKFLLWKTVKTVRWRATSWREMFLKSTSNKQLISKRCKEPLNLKSKLLPDENIGQRHLTDASLKNTQTSKRNIWEYSCVNTRNGSKCDLEMSVYTCVRTRITPVAEPDAGLSAGKPGNADGWQEMQMADNLLQEN